MKYITPTIRFLTGNKSLALASAVLAAGIWKTTPAPAAPSGQPAPIGGAEALGLDDRALGAELSGRGVQNLLDRYFKVNNVPEADRQAIKTVGALSELRKPGSTISYGEKLRRAREVAEGIDAVLPTLKDPNDMMATASIIKEFGVDQDVNSLEYWGEDPVTQAHLKPLSSAVVKLLDAAAVRAAAITADMEAHANLGDKATADKWTAMDNLSHTAEYSKNMSIYADCIATGPKVMVDKNKKVLTAAEVEEKKKAKEPVSNLRISLANGAILGLKDFDSADSGIQPRIRNMTAKLNMAAGQYTDARTMFATVFADKTDIVPPPNAFEQQEARYFSVVNELLANDLAAATSGKQALDTWEATVLPEKLKALSIDATRIAEINKGLSAANEMLQWRILVLTGDLAKDPTAKKAAEAAAEAILLKLRVSHPELAGRIDQQLVNRMPADKKIDETVAPSLLLALVKKGLNESYKVDPDKPDEVVLKKGIEAAQAVVKRGAGKELTSLNVTESKLAIATLQERLGDDVNAASNYLDFAVSEYRLDPRKATESFGRTGYLLFNKMGKLQIKPKGYEAVYNRFLPIAIDPPYNHTDLAYLYAEQLRDRKEFDLAIKYYALVPKDSPAHVSVNYKIMISLRDLLDPENPKRPDEALRKQRTADLVAYATAVKRTGDNPRDNTDRKRVVTATLILANLARMDKDAVKLIELLKGFDQLVDGLVPDGPTDREKADLDKKKKELKRGAKVILVQAKMQTGKINDAVQDVIELVKAANDNEGINLVRDLIEQLDKDYELAKAKIPPDPVAMREARKNQATLTHYLVDFSDPAKGQTNAKIVAFHYSYTVYDARMLREASALVETPAERQALLLKAKEAYQLLATKMKDLYLAQPDVKAKIASGDIDPADPDPQVAIGQALTAYELADFEPHDYKTPHDLLLPLVQQKKFGPPQIVVKDADGNARLDDKGSPMITVNKFYWKGLYAYIKCGAVIYKNDVMLKNVVIPDLKNLLIRGGIPDEFSKDFESLRKELCPEFNPEVVAAPSTPATQKAPAAPAAPAVKPK